MRREDGKESHYISLAEVVMTEEFFLYFQFICFGKIGMFFCNILCSRNLMIIGKPAAATFTKSMGCLNS
jgi:hypothetical protein